MLLLMLVTVIVPIALLAEAAGDHLPALFSTLRNWRAEDLHVPDQINSIPIVGESMFQWLTSLIADRSQSAALLQRALEPAGKVSLVFVRLLGDGLLQLLLVAFIVFFYYRDGERIAQLTQRISRRLSGEMSDEVLSIVVGTTRSVFISIVGTAAAQALVAYIGFLIAGVPGAFLLGVGTFVLSVVPMGPVVLWGGAAIWLYMQGEPGWAIFMVIWGAAVISSIDNFLKPLLIARGSTLSLGLIFLGVLGGVLAFGFIGVILGPVLLALGVSLGRAWITTRNSDVPKQLLRPQLQSSLPPCSRKTRRTRRNLEHGLKPKHFPAIVLQLLDRLMNVRKRLVPALFFERTNNSRLPAARQLL